MKKLLLPFALVLTSLILVTTNSCKKDESEEPEEENTQGTNNAQDSTHMKFTASVGGTAFQADTNSINYSYDEGLGLHVFTAPDNAGHIITLMLSSLTPGTYDVDFDNAIVVYQNGTTVYTGANNPQGEVVITKNQNNTLSGTFHADLLDFGTATNLSVTSGHFIHIPY